MNQEIVIPFSGSAIRSTNLFRLCIRIYHVQERRELSFNSLKIYLFNVKGGKDVQLWFSKEPFTLIQFEIVQQNSHSNPLIVWA